jgi:hypothetical protein
MSTEDAFELFLGDDAETLIKRYEQDIVYRWHGQRSGAYRPALVGSLSLILSIFIFFSFFLPWNTAFEVLGSNPGEHSDRVMVTRPGPERNLEVILHPEEHVSRDSGLRKFSWIITKAVIAPDGVQKNVFLINGISKYHLTLRSPL